MVIVAPALNFQPKQATLPVKSFLQRLLLVTEGNIKDILQAYGAETIATVKLNQRLIIADKRFSALQLQREYQILQRASTLQGSQSKVNYLYVDSQMILERLPAALRQEVMFSQQSLGKILQQHKLETYREIIDCGTESAGEIAQYFQLQPDAKLIYRTYLIVVNGLPVMQITEKFPSSYFLQTAANRL